MGKPLLNMSYLLDQGLRGLILLKRRLMQNTGLAVKFLGHIRKPHGSGAEAGQSIVHGLNNGT